MPRSLDTPAVAAARGGGAMSDYSPTKNLLDFSNIDDTTLQAGQIFIGLFQEAAGVVLGMIQSLTGVDLSPLLALIPSDGSNVLGASTTNPATGLTSQGIDLSSYTSLFSSLSPTMLLDLIESLSNVIGIGNLGTVLPQILSAFNGIDLSNPGSIVTAIENAVGTLIDAIVNGLGTSGSGFGVSSVLTALQNIPGVNIVTSLLASVIPGLDASKITSGTFSAAQLQPIIDAISTGFGGGSGLGFGGLTSLLAAIPGVGTLIDTIANALGISGSGLGIGSVTTALQNIPGLNIVTSLLASVIPGLDASKITSGTFSASQLQPLIDAVSAGFGGGSGLNFTSLTSLLSAIPGAQAVLDAIAAAMGISGTGHTPTQITSYLGAIPGANIATALLSSVIPGLDASKITSGAFPQSMITGLTSALGLLLPTGTFQQLLDAVFQAMNGGTSTGNTIAGVKTGLLNIPGANIATAVLAAIIPGLDASKITSGTFGNSMIPGLGQIADYIYQAINGGTSTGNPLSSILTSLQNIPGANIVTSLLAAVIPGLDASKITTGTFGSSLVPGLGQIADYVYQAINGGSSTGNALSTIKTSLLNIPGANIVTSLLASVIPGLDASKIVSGTFGSSLVPGLGNIADYIYQAINGGSSTGNALSTIKTSLLNIPGANIVTSLLASVIPGLDASKITTGTFGASFIPNITLGMSTAIQSVVDNIYQAINGGSSTGNTLASVKTGLLNIPGANIVSALLSSVIPGLDASKITTGTFGNAMVPGLQTIVDYIFQGVNGGTSTGNAFSTVKTALGAIPGGNIASALLASVIPALDASKITTGTFGAGLIPSLPAGQITSGTFAQGLIPSLTGAWGNTIASSLLSGVLGTGLIPGLDASKITSGVFGTGLIPNITAGMSTAIQSVIDNVYQAINGGSSTGNTLASVKTSLLNIPGANVVTALAAAVIPSLDASKITTGTLGTGLIPNLAASIITSGTFGTSLIPNITRTMSTDLQSTIDQFVQGYTGGSGTGNAPSALNTQAANINNRITALQGGGVLTTYSTNQTWTKPTTSPGTGGAYQANDLFTIICINGAQGGGKASSGPGTGMSPPGGINGGYVSQQFAYSALPASATLTIGAGGAGASSAGSGTAGGTTSFGSLVVGKFGVGGILQANGSYAASIPPGSGGAGLYPGTNPVPATPAYAGSPGAFSAGGTAGITAAGGAGGTAPTGVPAGGGGGGGGGDGNYAGGVGGFPGGGGGSGGGYGGSFGGGAAGAAGCIYLIAPY